MTPKPALAASMAASAVFTVSLGLTLTRCGFRPAKLQRSALERVLKLMQSCASRSRGLAGVPRLLRYAGLAQAT